MIWNTQHDCCVPSQSEQNANAKNKNMTSGTTIQCDHADWKRNDEDDDKDTDDDKDKAKAKAKTKDKDKTHRRKQV